MYRHRLHYLRRCLYHHEHMHRGSWRDLDSLRVLLWQRLTREESYEFLSLVERVLVMAMRAAYDTFPPSLAEDGCKIDSLGTHQCIYFGFYQIKDLLHTIRLCRLSLCCIQSIFCNLSKNNSRNTTEDRSRRWILAAYNHDECSFGLNGHGFSWSHIIAEPQ